MKIAFCISSLGKGGAERVVSILANHLSKSNEIIIILNITKNISYKLERNIKVLQLDGEKRKNTILKNVIRVRKIKKILKEEKPDIIISFLPMPSFKILFANRKTKIPIIISDRNNPEKEYKQIVYKILMKWLYPKANGFVFQTKEQKEFFSDKIQRKSRIIFNPIKEEFLEEQKSKVKDNVIISVGRLIEQKNHKMLINAFSKVAKKHPEYRLRIFGQGKLKEQLQNQINELNMQDKIFLCGISDNIKEQLEKSKIFAFPSNYEGMPNALIEAMAVGLPVIATDCPCGGPRELIQENINGILIPVNDELLMEKAINDLIEDKKFAKKIGDNAIKIKNRLAPEIIVKQWEEYIIDILQEREEI